jgi:hypothetical protein
LSDPRRVFGDQVPRNADNFIDDNRRSGFLFGTALKVDLGPTGEHGKRKEFEVAQESFLWFSSFSSLFTLFKQQLHGIVLTFLIVYGFFGASEVLSNCLI